MFKKISINQFAEYSSKKSESARMTLIRKQKEPDEFSSRWYRLAKSRIRKSLIGGGDLFPIYDGIETLINQSPEGNLMRRNKVVSIEALEQFVSMKLPKFLVEGKFEVIKIDRKSIEIKGLNIYLSPELVFKLTNSVGESIIGAMKIHICKSKPFSFQTAELASVVLYDFLKKIVNSNEIVDPRYCFTIDIFGNRIVPAPLNYKHYLDQIDNLCEEIVRYWDVA